MSHPPDPSGPVPVLPGLAPLGDRYDGWILDLWGTIHDGIRPLPGALDCMARLKAAGGRLLVLSNAPRRVDAVVARMDRVGIPRDLWDATLSSGEAAWQALARRPDDWHRRLGRRCLLIGRADDHSAVTGNGLEIVDRPAAAEFVVCVGLARPEETVADYEPLLRDCAGLGLPMVCANPDLEVLRGDVRELCAGALAARYETLGGEVRQHGKPHAPIYRTALDLLGIEDPGRVAAVGDSLRTDIAGARAAGIASVLVTGGIHARALGLRPGQAPRPDALSVFCDAAGVRPLAAVPAFCWEAPASRSDPGA